VFNTSKQVARTCIIVYEKYPTETKTVNKKHKIKIMKKRVHSLHYLSITKKEVTLTLHTYVNVHWLKVSGYSECHEIPQFYGSKQFITRYITACHGTLILS